MEIQAHPLRGKRSSLLWRDGGPMNSSNPMSNPLSNLISNPISNQNVRVGNRIFLKPTPQFLYPICQNENENQNEK
jgi:hypothetical protein